MLPGAACQFAIKLDLHQVFFGSMDYLVTESNLEGMGMRVVSFGGGEARDHGEEEPW